MSKELYLLEDINKTNYPEITEVYKLIENIFDLSKKRKYEEVYKKVDKLNSLIKELKKKAITNKDEKSANILFLVKLYVKSLDFLNKFWRLSEKLEYQDAWSCLQDAIDPLYTISNFIKEEDDFSVMKILDYLERIEKLYPFVYFNSIETVNKKKTCSICKKSPFSKECNHLAGRLYMGEMAYNTVEDFEFLGVSLVKNPADKKCIIFMNCDKQNIEKTPFKLIHFLVNYLKHPLKNFKLELTKRKLPRSYYDNWSKNSLCPCGSENSFENCCYDKEFIENLHYNIIEDEEVNLNLLN